MGLIVAGAAILGALVGCIYAGVWLMNAIDRAGRQEADQAALPPFDGPDVHEADAIAYDAEAREQEARRERAIAAWRAALATSPDLTPPATHCHADGR